MKQVYTYDMLERNGRLGNQLWQIAATVVKAELNDGFAFIKPDWEYRKFFSVPDRFFDWPSEQVIQVDGGTEYFQSLRYLEPMIGLVKTMFDWSEYALSFVSDEELDEMSGSCSLHVRRGDYLNHPGHFPISSSKFYRTAVEKIRAANPGGWFQIFSDDIMWCRNNLDFFGLTEVEVRFHDPHVRPVEVVDRIGEPRDFVDLLKMTCCKHHIVANSTFSWWGAFLSDDENVLYPSEWFNSLVPNWETWEEAIPVSWEKIEC